MLQELPVAHVIDIPNLLMSIIDEMLSMSQNEQIVVKISADHGQQLMKIGAEVP